MEKTPVLLIIFNRPDKVATLISALEKVRPSRLFISADGPRAHVETDARNCAEAREAIKAISWPCEVVTNFSDANLGCKIGVSSAITWFFSKVEEGIILEDDCIPSPSFLPYAQALLKKYRFNDHVMHISGSNALALSEISDKDASYRFSRIASIWGWATWKRAWDTYDIDMTDIERLRTLQATNPLFTEQKHLEFWIHLFNHIQNHKIDTWDSQWQYTVLAHDGVAVSPNVNLIDNIGFGIDATHTKGEKPRMARVNDLVPPFKDPGTGMVDMRADAIMMQSFYIRSLWQKILSYLKIG